MSFAVAGIFTGVPSALCRTITASPLVTKWCVASVDLTYDRVCPRQSRRSAWSASKTQALPRLFEAIDRAVEPFGIAREKKRYHPHVTIGRVKGRLDAGDIAPGMEELDGIDYGTLDVGAVTFFMSDLTTKGPIYTALATIPIG